MFTHGHAGPEPFDEIIRILRPGGIFVCTVHKDIWELRGYVIENGAERYGHVLTTIAPSNQPQAEQTGFDHRNGNSRPQHQESMSE